MKKSKKAVSQNPKKSFFEMISSNNKRPNKRPTPKRSTARRPTPNIFTLNVPNKKAQSKRYKLLMKKDIDKDGVPNYRDCRPFDRRRQDNGVIISDYDNMLHSLLRGRKPSDLSFSEYTGLLKDAMRKTTFIKTVNGYGIYATKWKGRVIYNAMDKTSGKTVLTGRDSLEDMVKDIKDDVIGELRREDPEGHSLRGQYEYMKRSGKEHEKHGGRAARFRKRGGDKVLDLGAGSNPDLRATHAIDLVHPDKRFENLEYEHGYDFSKERTRLPYRDNTFDTVVSYGALGRNFETQTIYNEVHRVLKPGGRLEFNPDSQKTFIFLERAGFEEPHTEYYFDRSLNKKIGVLVTKK